MNGPHEVSEILLAMLGAGLLRIRSLAWSGQSDLCAIEADHIHNLPNLLVDYSPEKLRYYWEVERTSYIERVSKDQIETWERLWERLRHYAENLGATAPVGY